MQGWCVIFFFPIQTRGICVVDIWERDLLIISKLVDIQREKLQAYKYGCGCIVSYIMCKMSMVST